MCSFGLISMNHGQVEASNENVTAGIVLELNQSIPNLKEETLIGTGITVLGHGVQNEEMSYREEALSEKKSLVYRDRQKDNDKALKDEKKEENPVIEKREKNEAEIDTGVMDVQAINLNTKGYAYKYAFRVPNGEGTCNSACYPYMDYRCVTSTRSTQYKILRSTQSFSDTKHGIRMVHTAYGDRYCIAIGQGYKARCGALVDVVLKDGTIIPCIVGDMKAGCDTDRTMRYAPYGGSVVEIVVDYACFNRKASQYADIFHGQVDHLRIITENWEETKSIGGLDYGIAQNVTIQEGPVVYNTEPTKDTNDNTSSMKEEETSSKESEDSIKAEDVREEEIVEKEEIVETESISETPVVAQIDSMDIISVIPETEINEDEGEICFE